jgi:ribose transport system substrate-binding protein
MLYLWSSAHLSRLRLWPLLIACLAVALASGCGKEPPAGTPPAQLKPAIDPIQSAVPSTQPLTRVELDQIKKPSKPYKLVLIVKTRNNPFFKPMIEEFEKECAALGVQGEVQAPAQEVDKEVQFSYVQTIAAKGADAILIAPADSRGIVPALKAAQDKGIVIVNLDNRVDKEATTAQGLTLGGYVGADNEAGGRLAGEAMVKALGGTGKVAIIEGIRGVDNAEARRRGFESAVNGKLTVVTKASADWDMNTANGKVQSILAAHPDITGIFCANDMMALGAVKAVEQAGKQGKVTVIGYDNIPDVQEPLKSGKMAATIEQHPDYMGRYGVKMAVGLLAGQLAKGREYLVDLEVKSK